MGVAQIASKLFFLQFLSLEEIFVILNLVVKKLFSFDPVKFVHLFLMLLLVLQGVHSNGLLLETLQVLSVDVVIAV